MFETSVPDAFLRRTHRAAWESLPLSVALHVVGIAVFLIAPQWRAIFPEQPPPLVRPYVLAAIDPPPPPPTPPSAQPASASAAAAAARPIAMAATLAPRIIPDAIPVVPMRMTMLAVPDLVALPDPAPSAGGGTGGNGEGTGAGGGNDAAKSGGGERSARRDGLMGGVLVGDRVEFARGVNLPLFVERKRYPNYPEDGRLLHHEDDVIVRYVIAKDGRVREIIVLEHPQWPMFEEAALAALRTWKFRPFLVDGQAREVVHELQISFRLE